MDGSASSEGEEGEEGDFLFYEGATIVGWIDADCYVCAWKRGHVKWPNAAMGHTLDMDSDDLVAECVLESNVRHRRES